MKTIVTEPLGICREMNMATILNTVLSFSNNVPLSGVRQKIFSLQFIRKS
jgi:hypothetical protein